MQQTTYTLTKIIADDDKLFCKKELDKNNKHMAVGKVLFLGVNDSINNYLELDKSSSEISFSLNDLTNQKHLDNEITTDNDLNSEMDTNENNTEIINNKKSEFTGELVDLQPVNNPVPIV